MAGGGPALVAAVVTAMAPRCGPFWRRQNPPGQLRASAGRAPNYDTRLSSSGSTAGMAGAPAR